MSLVVVVFGMFVAALGALGLASPGRLLDVVRSFQTRAGLYTATAIRLLLGVALFVAAPTSRAPGPLRVLGVVVFLAGLATPLFGLARYRRLLDWWSAQGPDFVRVWAAVACAFGVVLIWAVVP